MKISIDSGHRRYPALSHDERDRRWRLARDLMAECGLDALLIFGDDRHPIDSYFTNDRPGIVLIFPRQGAPVGLCWSTQVITAHLTNLERGEDSWIQDLRRGARSRHVIAALQELGFERSAIGVVGVGGIGNAAEEGYVAYKTWCSISEGLPGVRFQEVDRELYLRISIKSDEELELMRFAARAGEEACAAMLATTRPGVSERDIYMAAMNAMLGAGARSTWMIFQSGQENIGWGVPSWLYRSQPSRLIEEGDVVMAEMFPYCGMLETQQQMCIAVGEVSPVYERCAEVARQAYEAGLAVLRRPTPTFGELVAEMEAPVKAAGGWNLTPMVSGISHMGHESGSVALDMADHVPEIRRYRSVSGMPTRGVGDVLRPGMSFAFEPNCQIGRRRINVGGTVVMTTGDPLELNDLPNRMQRVSV